MMFLKLFDQLIQRILVKKATPDWLPFVPGSSFWSHLGLHHLTLLILFIICLMKSLFPLLLFGDAHLLILHSRFHHSNINHPFLYFVLFILNFRSKFILPFNFWFFM
ncbi:hypothetical protein Lalb_Chr08g0231811 [Lupinus albus]|uniref:Uncharacterized protein n=1 Tax=Lupinus albus TaxID=3870 RepID=A0A6A4Q2M1_LUPAL|nr:hypothetical protein Lalb_Chr08g0231811 [Lupinus albus]